MNFRTLDGQGWNRSKTGAPIFIYGDPTFINHASENGDTRQRPDSSNAIPVVGGTSSSPEQFWHSPELLLQQISDLTTQLSAAVEDLRQEREAKGSTKSAMDGKLVPTGEGSMSKPSELPLRLGVVRKDTKNRQEAESEAEESEAEETNREITASERSNAIPPGAPENCTMLGPDSESKISYTLSKEGTFMER